MIRLMCEMEGCGAYFLAVIPEERYCSLCIEDRQTDRRRRLAMRKHVGKTRGKADWLCTTSAQARARGRAHYRAHAERYRQDRMRRYYESKT